MVKAGLAAKTTEQSTGVEKGTPLSKPHSNIRAFQHQIFSNA